MRTPVDIGIELRTRNVYVRQYFGMLRFDVWADDVCYGSFVSPLEAEACVRNLINVTLEEEDALLDSYIERVARGRRATVEN